MEPLITQLLPPTGEQRPLQGLYLNEQLQSRGSTDTPFVYTNFVTSLDGRIALPAADRQSHQVPAAIANARDWRLYQELAAQADVLITSARYFRQSKVGEQQDLLPLCQGEAFADLHRWRQQQGLKPQPDVVVLSSSLELPAETLRNYHPRTIYLATGAANDQDKARALASAGNAELILAGKGKQVDGRALVQELGKRGYRSLYAIAGPAVFHTLVAAGVLQRLYLTQGHALLGGTEFDTLNWGPVLPDAVRMHPVAMYLDPDTNATGSQLFCSYDCHYREQPG